MNSVGADGGHVEGHSLRQALEIVEEELREQHNLKQLEEHDSVAGVGSHRGGLGADFVDVLVSDIPEVEAKQV